METIIISIIKSISTHKTKHIEQKIDKIAIESIKNFLVRTLSEIENGEEIDEVVKLRLYEQYDTYTNIYHQNSFIHSKWEKLRKEGKL